MTEVNEQEMTATRQVDSGIASGDAPAFGCVGGRHAGPCAGAVWALASAVRCAAAAARGPGRDPHPRRDVALSCSGARPNIPAADAGRRSAELR